MNNLYNTLIEISTRVLNVFSYEGQLTTQRAACFDYMAIYANDFNNELNSIHPKNKNRTSDLVSMLPLYEKCLNYLVLKGLVSVTISKKGIMYRARKGFSEYLNLISGAYLEKYRKNLKIIYETYGSLNNSALGKLVDSNIRERRI